MYTREQDIAYIRGTLSRLRKSAERDHRRTAIRLIDALSDYLDTFDAGEGDDYLPLLTLED